MATKTVTALNKQIEEFLKKRGAIRVGFATLDTLAGGPPSTDITYLLPEARSAISFALPLNRDLLRLFLAKEEMSKAEADDRAVNKKSSELGHELAKWLETQGHKVVAPKLNNEIYRTEVKGWKKYMYPDISHRYIAVRSGVGSFGWSGNVGIKDWGTAIILNTVVTDAELSPTDPIPAVDSFCTECKRCVSACTAQFFDAKEKQEITMGDQQFIYSRRHSPYRCQLVCGGFSGVHRSKKWSTWSPGRFEIPVGDDEKALINVLAGAVLKYTKWPEREPPGGFFHPLLPNTKLRLTCGMCQKICWGNDEDTKKNYELLINSGCVVQKPDGEILVLPPDEAQKVFDEFPPKHRRLYTLPTKA
ncbi:MAG: epoxyqueuosine reductase [Candidatus Helarchaeota archaeon]|nr:epoxyqueuosine reductase [Candidatus Helarchaeota archaeon]